MGVTQEHELPSAMTATGLQVDGVSEVVLTHGHGDHIDGLVHTRCRVQINDVEKKFVASPMPGGSEGAVHHHRRGGPLHRRW
ncbi:MAG TPA: hypothetical protein VG223_15720 [Solirubrobacteraceae bacterium]|nr:hypothetical protein [Solirubrobacteraceae bacterium]